MAALFMMNQMHTTGIFSYSDPLMSSRSSQQMNIDAINDMKAAARAEAEKKTMDYIRDELRHMARNRNLLELINAIIQVITCRVAPLAMRPQILQLMNNCDGNLSALKILNKLHHEALQETPNITTEKKSLLRRFVDYIKAIPKKISTYFLSEAKFLKMVWQHGMGIEYFIYKIRYLLTDSFNFKELSCKEYFVKAICFVIAFAIDYAFTRCLPGLPGVVGFLVGIVAGFAGPFVIPHLMDLTSWVYKKICEFVRSHRSPAKISSSNLWALGAAAFLGGGHQYAFPSTMLRC